jgi:hypothetical protein
VTHPTHAAAPRIHVLIVRCNGAVTAWSFDHSGQFDRALQIATFWHGEGLAVLASQPDSTVIDGAAVTAWLDGQAPASELHTLVLKRHEVRAFSFGNHDQFSDAANEALACADVEVLASQASDMVGDASEFEHWVAEQLLSPGDFEDWFKGRSEPAANDGGPDAIQMGRKSSNDPSVD